MLVFVLVLLLAGAAAAAAAATAATAAAAAASSTACASKPRSDPEAPQQGLHELMQSVQDSLLGLFSSVSGPNVLRSIPPKHTMKHTPKHTPKSYPETNLPARAPPLRHRPI